MDSKNNSYGKNWPDTWVIFFGKVDSSALATKDILETRTSLDIGFSENVFRFDPGRALPFPWHAQKNGCTVVFDGHLYNRSQLIEECQTDPQPADNLAALLLDAYDRWGEDFVSHLSGIFSLVLWDEKKDIFLAVRDPVGIYPLFCAETPEGRFFSLSIQALLALPEVPKTINRTVLALYLSLFFGRKEETFYESIERVPPGHLLRIQKGQKERIRYWNPARADGEVDWIQNASSEQFEELLQKVADDFHEFGPLGIYLSGGLDSVTVAAYTKDASVKLKKPAPKAYSLVFPNIGKLEEPVQRGIAEGLDLPLFITSLKEAAGPRGLIQSAIDLTCTWPAPMQNTWRPAYNLLGQQAVQDGCSAIITGTGGDEWLGLNPFYCADLIRQFNLSGLYRMVIGMWRSWPFPLRVHIYNGLWKFGARPLLARGVARILARFAPNTLRNRRRKSLYQSVPYWLELDLEIKNEISIRMDERVEESIIADKSKSFLIKEIIYFLDHPISALDMEEEFENGRRLGMPILGFYQHQDLVSYLFRFPPHLLNTGRPQKGLIREIVQKRFPQLGFQKQKKIGATDNFRETVLDESPIVWEKLGGVQSLSHMKIVNANSVKHFITSTKENPPKNNQPIWMIWNLINFESWLRNMVNL